jgi:hypothetical protein
MDPRRVRESPADLAQLYSAQRKCATITILLAQKIGHSSVLNLACDESAGVSKLASGQPEATPRGRETMRKDAQSSFAIERLPPFITGDY